MPTCWSLIFKLEEEEEEPYFLSRDVPLETPHQNRMQNAFLSMLMFCIDVLPVSKKSLLKKSKLPRANMINVKDSSDDRFEVILVLEKVADGSFGFVQANLFKISWPHWPTHK